MEQLDNFFFFFDNLKKSRRPLDKQKEVAIQKKKENDSKRVILNF